MVLIPFLPSLLVNFPEEHLNSSTPRLITPKMLMQCAPNTYIDPFYSVFVYVFFLSVLSIENDTIYWTDMGFNKISRAKRDQTWKEDIITNGLGRVEGIAIDWIAGIIHGFLCFCFTPILLVAQSAS